MSADFPGRCYSRVELDSFNIGTELDIHRVRAARTYSRKTGVYHPSSMSKSACLRALYYDRTDAPVSRAEFLKDIDLFAVGHSIHDGLGAELREAFPGIQLEVPVEMASLHLAGSADGLLRDWVLEFKSIGDASYKALTKPKTEHVWQVHCYMAALNVPRAQIMYINRNTGQRRTFRVAFDPSIWSSITSIIASVESCVASGTPPAGVDKRYTCASCKFAKHCEPSCLKTRS